MRIIIARGGIGGLTLAMMLHKRGILCHVFEAADELTAVGVGINALPHSIRELAGLGLLPELDAIGIRTRKLTYVNQLGSGFGRSRADCLLVKMFHNFRSIVGGSTPFFGRPRSSARGAMGLGQIGGWSITVRTANLSWRGSKALPVR